MLDMQQCVWEIYISELILDLQKEILFIVVFKRLYKNISI